MRDNQTAQASGAITGLPTSVVKSEPRYRLLREGSVSVLRKIRRKIGGVLADLFYW